MMMMITKMINNVVEYNDNNRMLESHDRTKIKELGRGQSGCAGVLEETVYLTQPVIPFNDDDDTTNHNDADN